MDELTLLNECCQIHPQRIEMLIDDLDFGWVELTLTEREILTLALKLVQLLQEKNKH